MGCEVAELQQEAGKPSEKAKKETAKKESGRRGYHHGNLREALIEAAEALIAERGPDSFTMADACRHAGVSTAAPYRHFEDRNALLEAVCMRAFEGLAEATGSAKAPFEEGSEEAILAGGKAYLGFALENPARFRLMFGRNPDIKSRPNVEMAGRLCFQNLLQSVLAYLAARGHAGEDPMPLALRLWSLVHGVANLAIDGPMDIIAPGNNPEAIIEASGRAILAAV